MLSIGAVLFTGDRPQVAGEFESLDSLFAENPKTIRVEPGTPLPSCASCGHVIQWRLIRIFSPEPTGGSRA